MGINPPSLYAAFGNKEGLFRKSLDRCGNRARLRGERRLAGADGILRAVEVARHRRTLSRLGEMQPCRLPPGAGAAGARAINALRFAAGLGERRGERRLIRERSPAPPEGDLQDADPASLARYISTVTQGMAVQAVKRRLSRADFAALPPRRWKALLA